MSRRLELIEELQSLPPAETWEVFQAAIGAMGTTGLHKIYGRHITQFYRWARNPEHTSDSERNPIDRLILLLRRLTEQGESVAAEGALRMMANAIGFDVAPTAGARPDKETLEEECLDDYPAVCLLHALIRDGEHVNLIRQRAAEAKREIDETVAAYEARAGLRMAKQPST